MGGGGLMGSILTTLESTLGGGLKLFLPTCGRAAAVGEVPMNPPTSPPVSNAASRTASCKPAVQSFLADSAVYS